MSIYGNLITSIKRDKYTVHAMAQSTKPNEWAITSVLNNNPGPNISGVPKTSPITIKIHNIDEFIQDINQTRRIIKDVVSFSCETNNQPTEAETKKITDIVDVLLQIDQITLARVMNKNQQVFKRFLLLNQFITTALSDITV